MDHPGRSFSIFGVFCFAAYDDDAGEDAKGDVEVVEDNPPDHDKDPDNGRGDEDGIHGGGPDFRYARTARCERYHHQDREDQLDHKRFQNEGRLAQPDQDKGGSDDLGYPVEQGEDHSPDKPTLSAPHELDNCVVEVVDLLVSPREEFLDTAVLPGFGKEERAAVDHPLYHVGPPDCQVEEEQASCHEYPG